MQLLNKQAEDLALEILDKTKNIKIQKNLEIILCPSFTALDGVGEIIKDSKIKLGAQDVFYKKQGADTGEISIEQLKELGVEYVIIGHSETRKDSNETDEDINKMIIIALENNLIPILCIGETKQERQEGKTNLILNTQISKALKGLKLESKKLIIAYEPIWAISPNPSAKSEDVQDVIQIINQNLNNNISIIYGGSVNADNINNFLDIDLINGALVGSASLSSDKFIKIIKNI